MARAFDACDGGIAIEFICGSHSRPLARADSHMNHHSTMVSYRPSGSDRSFCGLVLLLFVIECASDTSKTILQSREQH